MWQMDLHYMFIPKKFAVSGSGSFPSGHGLTHAPIIGGLRNTTKQKKIMCACFTLTCTPFMCVLVCSVTSCAFSHVATCRECCELARYEGIIRATCSMGEFTVLNSCIEAPCNDTERPGLAAFQSRSREPSFCRFFLGGKLSGWWVGTFFIFPYMVNNHPN